MMHSTLGVEKALGEVGQLSSFIAWAQPFRMPDFFLLSGLFLSRRITMPWLGYIDKKVVHFVYFYILWMCLQLLLKGFGIVQADGVLGLLNAFALALVEPFGTLWFIYLLPVFFVVTKLVRPLPALLVFCVAAALEVLPIHTGWIMVDEFAARYVYFFAGYWLAAHVFRFAWDMDSLSKTGMCAALTIWAIVHTQLFLNGVSDWPGMGLVLGFFGTGAVVTAGVLLARLPMGHVIRYLGEHSLVIYLSFFMFMAASRAIAVRLVPELGPDVISLGVTLAGIVGPLLLMWLTRGTWARYLFKRPAWAKLDAAPVVKLETAPKVWHATQHDPAQISNKPLPR
jgi:uncharacterized membrane protein YcfT